ncbi:MAG: hypothetical protein MI810_11785 [Flavobacteriales bacterium]|nr:hypothetical protein [Flavobacteriales bacterium]
MSILTANTHIRSADAALAEWKRCTNFQMYFDLFYDSDENVRDIAVREKIVDHILQWDGEYKDFDSYSTLLPMPGQVFRDYLAITGNDTMMDIMDDHCYVPSPDGARVTGQPMKLVTTEHIRALVKFHMTQPV